MYSLQSRWKLTDKKLIYYGVRSGEKLNKNVIKISGRQAAIVASLPRKLTEKEVATVRGLIAESALTEGTPFAVPKSLKDARFCASCAANDFIIPGLQFNRDGLCSMCEHAEDTAQLKSVVPVLNDIPRSKKSRFDVAVFYTGGKDSTYLLYYLSVVKKLRVLALTWEIPYISDSARASIENAKRKLDRVEFVTRSVCAEDLRIIYRKLYELNGNTCACPSLAYVLFYPTLVEERVPYFVAGNEPAQLLGLYFNGMSPRLAYGFARNKGLNFLVNLGRILTLHPPLKLGQFHTLTTMKGLAYGTSAIVKRSKYDNEIVNGVTEAIHCIPSIVKPLKRSIRKSSFTGRIPAFVQVDFDDISGGTYVWTDIKDIIARECGWVAPEDSGKGLHTSCSIERCKEYTQFKRFYEMKSRVIPFSALEISLAGRKSNVTREQAVYEMEHVLGFSLEEIAECAIMREFFEEK